jgi:hypothetical protein
MRQPKPPKSVSPAAKKIWRELTTEFAIDDAAGLRILADGLESWDRAQQCREAIGDDLVVMDRYGSPKPHPLLTLERDYRDAWLRALKALNLDVEPTRDGPGRPPGR